MEKRESDKPTRKNDEQPSGLLGGLIFLSVLLLFVGVLAFLVWQAGSGLLQNDADAPDSQAVATGHPSVSQVPSPTDTVKPVSSPGPTMTVIPSMQPGGQNPSPLAGSSYTLPERIVLVNPAVPPQLDNEEKLVQTEPFVGRWKSFQYNAQQFNNYRLTIYNDGTYVIYDYPNETYITGKWTRTYGSNFPKYRAFEGGKTGIVDINDLSEKEARSLVFTYNNLNPTVTVSYIRVA